MNTFNINRRSFLQGATAALALTSFGARGMDLIHPPKPFRVGLIGTGWYGKSDLFRLIQVAPVEVIALCDVDKNQLKEAGTLVSQRQKSGKIPKLYGDYQKLLAENELDIVLIGTPDHWHALPMIDAVKKGSHVYVQKPISVDVMEGEAMVAAARKYKKVVQVGTQRKSTPHLIDAKKNIVDAGLLGKISHVKCAVITICETTETRPWKQFLISSIMKNGPARHRCGPMTACHISAGGALSWNMVTVSRVICAYICSIPCAGC